MICVNSVSVSPSSVTLQIGQWYYSAKAIVCPTNADCKSVRWHSDNTNVATVNASSGYIYAKAIGTTKIYATATDGSGKSDYITVTVSNTVPVTSVTLNKENVSLEKGDCTTLMAAVSPANATNKTLNWTSSKPSVVSVQSNGVVCAHDGGSAVITATATDGSGVCDCCIVTVTEDVLVTSITVESNKNTLYVEESCYVRANVLPANATNRNVTWFSNNNNVATVNPTSGLVVAQNPGTAGIYATATDGSGVMGCSFLTVKPLIPAESITIAEEVVYVRMNSTKFLAASLCPCDTTDSVTWTSSNPNIATVGSHTGKITPVAPGTVTISARAGQNLSASITVHVVIDDVTIMKDTNNSDYNRIVFESSGKVWHCINSDMINGFTFSIDDPRVQRLYDDTLEDWSYIEGFGPNWEALKTYSDEELRLIYSVDPYGLANYVKLYSDLCYGGSTADKLSYKDYVFELIYGYPPKYYTRISLGDWRETENISNLNVVLSESEFIFGMHMIYDSETIAELVEIAADMIISLISCVNPVIGEAVDVVCSFGTWIHNVIYKKQLIDFEGMASDEIDSIIGETMMELGLDWAYNCISFGNSLDELLQLISDYPHYEIAINRCMEDLPYNVYIKPRNGAKYAVSEIYDVLNQE